MRGVRAKQLRREALKMSAGNPAIGYAEQKHATAKRGGQPVTILLSYACTRATYKDLKRFYIREFKKND